jgi:hypothetical protein
MAIRSSSLASAYVPVGGPAGLPGQSTFAAWLTLPGNAGKQLADFIAAQKGDPGGVTTLAGKVGALGLDDIGALAKTGDASVTQQAAQDAAQSPATLPMPRIAKSIPRDKPLSPFWWIDPAREWGIRNGLDVADTQPMLQSALNAGEDLDLGSGGRFYLSDKLSYKRQCQRILGSRPFSDLSFTPYRYGASLVVASGVAGRPSFNLSASSVIQQTHECVLSGVGIFCVQPGSAQLGRAPQRSDLIRYPWIVDQTQASRARLEDVQVGGAWNGINGNSNAVNGLGGAYNWRDLELGCYNEIYHIGCTGTDFVTIDNVRAWAFGISPELQTIYNASSPVAIIEGVDGGSMTRSTFWRSRLIYNNPSNLGFNLGDLFFDGGSAQDANLIMVGGNATISSLKCNYDTQAQGLHVIGAKVVCGLISMTSVGMKTPDNPMILVDGPAAVLQSAVTRLEAFYDNSHTANNNCQTVFAVCSAGEMNLGETRVSGINNVARTQPVIWQKGSAGRLSVTNLRPDDVGSGSGTLLQIDADNQHNILGVQKTGWAVALPSTQNFGNYVGINQPSDTMSATFRIPNGGRLLLTDTAGRAAGFPTIQSDDNIVFQAYTSDGTLQTLLAYQTNKATKGAWAFNTSISMGGNIALNGFGLTTTSKIAPTATGNLTLGNGSALATTATAGMILVPSGSGAPTGAPVGAQAGATPMYVDLTNLKLWFYIGSTWRGVALA